MSAEPPIPRELWDEVPADAQEAGSVARPTLRSYVAGLKPIVRSLLESGPACGCPWTTKVCRKLREGFAHLWTFAAAAGVPPHNNAAERALRHGVIWRRASHGTDGERAAGSSSGC